MDEDLLSFVFPTTNIHNYTSFMMMMFVMARFFMKRWRSTSFLGIDVRFGNTENLDCLILT